MKNAAALQSQQYTKDINPKGYHVIRTSEWGSHGPFELIFFVYFIGCSKALHSTLANGGFRLSELKIFTKVNTSSDVAEAFTIVEVNFNLS